VIAVKRLLNALDDHGCRPRRVGGQWSARCPAHEDRHPSLSLTRGRDDRVLLNCHAGCPIESVVSALGLTIRDLMPSDNSDTDKTPRRRPESRVSSVSVSSAPSGRTYPTARAAVANLERRRGRRSMSWTYHNATGEPVGVILRWDRPGGKMIIPVSRFEDGWQIAGMPSPRPLYRMGELRNAVRVYICEGEKAADAASSLGLIATTSAHGSSSPHKSDWTPLAGKECILLPDNDDAGRAYAEAVADILHRLRPRPIVKIVDLPGLPPGGDIADLVSAGRSSI